jgi:UDP-2,4-diacetamido-2,4,6-trideoxy-beta-L-altropyranose hydrolase
MDVQGTPGAGSTALSGAIIAFRADASLDIGSGHVMRCLTMANALRRSGAVCRFVCRGHNGNLLEQIRLQGFDAHALPVSPPGAATEDVRPGESLSHAAWLGADWETDAMQTEGALGDTCVDWLIVDHYALDIRWEKRLRTACRHLMVIDDLADRSHDCDVLLDQNLNRRIEDYAGLVPSYGKVLVGPMFALLREEFAALREYSFARRATPKLAHLLVSLGGVDKDNVTGRVLEALGHCALPTGCRITVALGANAPWISDIRAQATRMSATDVVVGTNDIARLMADCDLAIGAAGTSAWERCCLGLPTLLMVLASNQSAGARALHEAGAAILLDERQNQLAFELKSKIHVLVESEGLQQIQLACRRVTDGMGVARVVEMIDHEN